LISHLYLVLNFIGLYDHKSSVLVAVFKLHLKVVRNRCHHILLVVQMLMHPDAPHTTAKDH